MIKRPLCLMAVILAACILAAQWLGISWIWRSPAGTQPEEYAMQEDTQQGNIVQAEGTVYRQEEKTYQNQIVTYLYLKHTNLYIHSKKYPIRNIKCEMEGTQDQTLGCNLRIEGALTLPESPGNPGEFDRKSYERGRKIDFYLKNTQVLERTRAGKTETHIEAIRGKCRGIIQEIFPETEAGILEAMLLGEKELLDEDTKSGFQAAGISHIIAISGLHISLLGIGVWNGLKCLGLPMTVSSVCSLFLLAGYGVLIGNPVTAVRALIMFGLMLGAKLLGRTYDLLSALAAASILLLLDNPDLLWDSGFQMSFAAVAGMGSYGEFQRGLWQTVKSRRSGKISCGKQAGIGKQKGSGEQSEIRKRKIKRIIYKLGKAEENLVTGCSLWVFMLPVVLYTFYQVSVLGILCNLLVLPLMPAVLGSGFLALLLGFWGTGAGSIGGIPAYGIVRLYEWLGKTAGNIPMGVWTPGRPTLWAVAVYYGILAVSCAVCGKIMCAEGEDKYSGGKIAVFQVFVLFLTLLVMAAPWKQPDKITVLDVGQGDGIVLQTGKVQALVDGGSTSKSKVGKYVILPYLKYEGISRLEGIFLTHSDQDHINGVKEVLEEAEKGWLTVERVFFPVWMGETPEGKEICRLAENCGAACISLRAGDKLEMGKARIYVLHPEEENYSDDANAGSLVFVWELNGMRALFTGDLPAEEERKLLDKLPVCTMLKTAHHGSRYSTSEEFLERVNPRAALISCGKNNRYGHPGQETIDRIMNSGSSILRTDEQGALIVTGKRNGWQAEGFRRSLAQKAGQ